MDKFTVKQIAELLDVSKPTVQKVINAKGIKEDHIEKNKYRYYTLEQAKEIIVEINSDFDLSILSPNTEKFTEKQPKSTDNVEKLAVISENISENPQKDSDTILKLLDMMQKEIDKKDKELEKKDKRIEKLEQTIEEHTKTIADLAKQASYITAADKTAQIIDKKQEPTEAAAAADDKPVKKKWFKFW